MSTNLINSINKRCSRTCFLNEPINCLGEVKRMLAAINSIDGISFDHIEEGRKIFSQTKPLYGNFRNINNIIIARADKGDVNGKEKVGYYGQKLILELTSLGLGSSWVGLDFNNFRDSLNTPKQDFIAMIIFGAIEEQRSSIEQLMFDMLHKDTVEITTVFNLETPPTPVTIQAIGSVMKAPSFANKMKPRFNINSSTITVSVENNFYTDLIDLGIFKLHFEIGTNTNFRFPLGNNVQAKY